MRLMCSSSEHESECIPPVISTGQGHKQDISGMWRKGNCYVCGACVCVCVTKNCKNLAVALTYTFLGKLDLFVSGSFPQLPSRLKSDSQALTSLTSKQLLRCLCSNYYSLTPFPMMLFFFDCLPSWPPVSLSFFSLEVKTWFIHSFDTYLLSISYISDILSGSGSTSANKTNELFSLRAWWQCDEGWGWRDLRGSCLLLHKVPQASPHCSECTHGWQPGNHQRAC